jgi:uncharacterized protein
MLSAARWSGRSWTEIGLTTRGAGWAAAALALTVLVYGVAALIPATRRLFRDPRYDVSPGRALYTTLIAVPLATAAVEEAAFRGALWPLSWATPLLFGLWHVLPGRRTNAAAPSRWVTFLVTTVGGVVFALLRAWSGGLLAPFVLHWGVDGLGVVVSCWVIRSRG